MALIEITPEEFSRFGLTGKIQITALYGKCISEEICETHISFIFKMDKFYVLAVRLMPANCYIYAEIIPSTALLQSLLVKKTGS